MQLMSLTRDLMQDASLYMKRGEGNAEKLFTYEKSFF